MKEDSDKDAALQEAIKRAGSANELARQIGVKPQAISQWKRVPIGRVPDVARITGIPRETLRPDVWGECAA